MEPTQPTPAPYTPPVVPAPMMSPPVTSGMGASKILAGLAVLLIVAAGAYYMGTDRGDEVTTLPTLTPSTVALPISSPMPTGSSEPTMCTADAKLCPDGSYVSRIAPTCEFAPCPTPTSSVPADWKTYTNAQYGFEVKYPKQFPITSGVSGQNNKIFTLSINPAMAVPETDSPPSYLNISVEPKRTLRGCVEDAKTSGSIVIDGISVTKCVISGSFFGQGEGLFVEITRGDYTFVFGADYYDKNRIEIDKILSTFKFTQ